MVAEQFLTALEGPMWKTIRGKGFAYGYGVRLDTESGLDSFNLFKSTKVVEAYKEGQAIVAGYVEGREMQVKLNDPTLTVSLTLILTLSVTLTLTLTLIGKWAMQVKLDETALESTKSTVISEIIGKESTVSAAALQSLRSYLGRPRGYNQTLLKQVSKVTLGEARGALAEYTTALFDNKTCNCVIVSSKDTAKSVIEQFRAIGKQIELYETLGDAIAAAPAPPGTPAFAPPASFSASAVRGCGGLFGC